jgi:hypothetical protein
VRSEHAAPTCGDGVSFRPKCLRSRYSFNDRLKEPGASLMQP